jgi:hypothetical protein
MYLLGNLNIWVLCHPLVTVNLAMSGYGGAIFCWVSVVESEGSKSDLVAPVWLDSDSTGLLSVSDKLTLGNRKCKYARFFANITGKMQIIKDYQLY